jgi:hypothetical protein
MRKPIRIICLLIFFSNSVFCQTIDVIVGARITENPENNKSGIFKTFYFHEASVDSSIFRKDSISIFKDYIDIEYPRVELFNDSTFCFFYKITNIDTTTIISFDTGEMKKIVTQDYNKVTGSYILFPTLNVNHDGRITFILNHEYSFDFNIQNSNNQVHLIRKSNL